MSEGVDVSQFGMTRGMVIDVNDPLKLCRVKVRVPAIHGAVGSDNYMEDEDIPWAYPCLPANVKQVPKVKDFVWVMFENNDVEMPVYMGVVLGKQSNSPEVPVMLGSGETKSVTYSNYEAPYDGSSSGTIFESPDGFKFTYNDTEKFMKIEKESMTFTLNNDSVVIQVGNSYIEIKSENIKISTPRLDEN